MIAYGQNLNPNDSTLNFDEIELTPEQENTLYEAFEKRQEAAEKENCDELTMVDFIAGILNMGIDDIVINE